jgi:hypothetical protein
MSFSEKNIATFIRLLETQLSLFSSQELTELQQLIDSLPDDIERISEELSAWYEEREKICDAQLEILNQVDSANANDRLIPKNGNYSKPKNNSELNKNIFQNSLKRASNSISDIQKSPDKQ